jgi:SAM-dependent methyltransferase
VKATCALCGETAVDVFVDFGAHPIAHQVLATPDEEPCTHREARLLRGVRPGAAHRSDPAERLYAEYNWLSAWKWNPHMPRLVELIAHLADVGRDGRIVEVGSNDGSFLAELRERGFTNLIGVEPAADAADPADARGVRTIRRYWDDELAHELVAEGGVADVLIARQVLEHVQDLDAFVAGLRAMTRPGSHVLVEVPDFGFNRSAPDYSAICEEHVNHFDADTLRWFLARAGVRVELVESALFSGQILIAYGRVDPDVGGESPAADASISETRAYADRWPRFRDHLDAFLAAERGAGHRVAVYGGGCRSCCLINYAGVARHLEYVVDDQEAKQQRYLPGSRLLVRPSEGLEHQPIDLCLLAVNAENEEAVIAGHDAYLAREGAFVSIHPPSPRLPAFWSEG